MHLLVKGLNRRVLRCEGGQKIDTQDTGRDCNGWDWEVVCSIILLFLFVRKFIAHFDHSVSTYMLGSVAKSVKNGGKKETMRKSRFDARRPNNS